MNQFFIFITFLCLSSLAFCKKCKLEDNYDYIVVGAGSAGSVVAHRLAANPRNKVLLLEAGERPNLLSEVPYLYSYMQMTKYDWNFTVQMPSPKCGTIPWPMPQGKILGGTSGINAMIYARGNKLDYDNWATSGAVGWEWENVLPMFKKSENNQDESISKNGYHGKDGEMYVQYPSYRTPLADKYLEAAEELGFKVGDVNGPVQTRFMKPQLTIHNGRRWGSHHAFIYPIEGKETFCVFTSAFVRKVLLEGNRAKGVQIDYEGKTRNIIAKKEVILSAGAIKSPQILMLSGIGPKKELETLGIPVASNLPVGKNFHDHVLTIGYNEEIKTNISGLNITETDYARFLQNSTGILSEISTEAIGYVRTKNIRKRYWPDTELIFLTSIRPSGFTPNDNATLVATSGCFAIVVRPKSRGEVTLKSTDPYEYPNIKPNYLSHNDDVEAVKEALEICHKFKKTDTMKSILKKDITSTKCENDSNDKNKDLNCLLNSPVLPSYHLAGSCKMGDPKDPTSVVDPQLRVIGVEGLRVIDNSIMPAVSSGHTHSVAVMIGEKGAQYILGDSPSDPQ